MSLPTFLVDSCKFAPAFLPIFHVEMSVLQYTSKFDVSTLSLITSIERLIINVELPSSIESLRC